MAYAAVLDADVLHPYNVADILLRLVERGLFRPIWSEAILNEVKRSLVSRDLPVERVERRVRAMMDAFPEAMVSNPDRFLPSVPGAVDPDDRHVVAAALAGRADGIVTNNVADFPANALAEVELDVQSVDEFLVNQLTLDEEAVLSVLREIETDRTRSPRTPAEFLATLERTTPRFVELAGSAMRGNSGPHDVSDAKA